MEKKKTLTLATLLLFSLLTSAQNTVRFVNTGAMCVGNNGGTTMYVPDAIKASKQSAIVQKGTTVLGGNFYQDSDNGHHAFVVDADGYPLSTGKIKFVSPTGDASDRYITTSGTLATFDRGLNYIAFPSIEIATEGKVIVPPTLGIDAINLSRSGTGQLYLASNVVGDKVINASLRLFGTAQAGAAIVEQHVAEYRGVGTNSSPLFGFASPFTNLSNGYFAGNYIRKMLEGNDNNVAYPYGNKPQSPGSNIISIDQYLRGYNDQFIPGQGYLIELQPEDYDYASLISKLLPQVSQNPDDYRIGTFVFDGKPSVISGLDKEDQLFTGSIIRSATTSSIPTWVIGNSYTAPLKLGALVDALDAEEINYEPVIYVYQQNSGYIPYSLAGEALQEPVQLMDLGDEIPSMSVFMLWINESGSDKTFTIDRSMLTHGTLGHNFLRSSNAYQNEVLFKVSPEANPRAYDLAAIGLRANASLDIDELDMEKAYLRGELSQIYFPVGNTKLASNAVPEGTEKVPMAFYPGISKSIYNMQASRLESLTTEGLWLEDTKWDVITDLHDSNGQYTFEAEPDDDIDRFVVHFRSPGVVTNIDDAVNSKLYLYYAGNNLTINNLQEQDQNSTIEIFDMQGRKLISDVVKQTPEMNIQVNLTEGVYLAKVNGKRSVTIKFNNVR